MIILERYFGFCWKGIHLFDFLSIISFDRFAGAFEDVFGEDKFVLINLIIEVSDESENLNGSGVDFLIGSLNEL